MNWIRNWVKRYFNLYDIEDLVVGGHCGCCGKWVDKVIVLRGWEWTLCEECENA